MRLAELPAYRWYQEFSSPSTTAIYGNKVTIWIWAKVPTVVLIENEAVARSYKKHFELMWKSIRK